jgi:copper transport protein
MNRRKRLIPAFGLLVLCLVATPGVAGAHAQLESSEPGQSAVLLLPPTRVVLHFGEPVEVDFGSLRVIGPGGARVDGGAAHHPGDDVHAVTASLPTNLSDGTYIVAWRVVSDDSHPVHGAYVFSVGTAKGAARADALAVSFANQTGDTTVGIAYWLVRTTAFIGLLTLVGLGVVVATLWSEGGRTRRVARVLWWSWWTVLTATIVGVIVQGVYASALPLSDAYRPSLISAVLRTRFGEVAVLRLVLLAVMACVLRRITKHANSRVRQVAPWEVAAVGAVGLGLLATPGLSGHAATGSNPALGLALDLVHLAAASAWVGGLVLLATFLLPKAPDDAWPPEPLNLTLRVSAVAFSAVCVVVGTGVVQSVRQVGSLHALVHTNYGQTLVIKVCLVVALVVVGALSRRLLHLPDVCRSPALDGLTFPRRRLRHTVVVELGIALAVVGVTGALVNDVPARQADGQPFSYSFTALGVQVNTIIDPARAGQINQVHVYILSSLGTPRAVPEFDLSVSLPLRSIGPLTIPLVVSGPGHYTANRFVLPVAGDWVLKYTVRTDAIDDQVVRTVLAVH